MFQCIVLFQLYLFRGLSRCWKNGNLYDFLSLYLLNNISTFFAVLSIFHWNLKCLVLIYEFFFKFYWFSNEFSHVFINLSAFHAFKCQNHARAHWSQSRNICFWYFNLLSSASSSRHYLVAFFTKFLGRSRRRGRAINEAGNDIWLR